MKPCMRRTLIVLVGLMLAFPLAVFAKGEAPNGPRRMLTVTDPVVVGSRTVSPGDYDFQCWTIDGREYLVVTSQRTGREVARVPCEPTALSAKATASSYRTVAGPNGLSILRSVQLKGEAHAHVVAAQ